MKRDLRSAKVVLVAHCILNQNSRVSGLARFPGMIREVVDVLRRHEVGVVQMPCPELLHAGLKRWSRTKEQYDTPFFRRYCRGLATALADQIEEYLRGNVAVLAVVGMDGSPTCGVEETSVGFEGGDLEKIEVPKAESVKGKGIFIEELQLKLEERNISIPFLGIKDREVEKGIAKLEELLKP